MKIKIAANYSNNLIKLIENKAIQLDYIKLSRADVIDEELDTARQYKPTLLHYLPHLGKPTIFWEQFDWRSVKKNIKLGQCPYLSLHLDAYHSEIGQPSYNDLLTLMLRNYQIIIDQIGQHFIVENKKILLENCDHAPYEKVTPEYDRINHVFQAQFINDFIKKSGAGLLLDLAHAQCSAHFLKKDIKAYLQEFDLASVLEIHLAGAREIDGYLIDTHYCLQDHDYQLLTWVLPQTKTAMVTLEYGGTGKIYLTKEKNDCNLLKKQLLKISQIINQYQH